jgi:hypothetical protein
LRNIRQPFLDSGALSLSVVDHLFYVADAVSVLVHGGLGSVFGFRLQNQFIALALDIGH